MSAGERNEGGEARNESAFGGENMLYVVTNKTASLSRKERDAVFCCIDQLNRCVKFVW